MAATISHPIIGKVQGKAGDGVTQYLGIKYGNLENRFSTATPVKYDSSSTLDATHHAPTALQGPDNVDGELGLIQHTLPFSYRQVSDLDGLALSITVPQGTTADSALPVFAFIHGGGFQLGSTTWPQYDMTRIVRLSAQRGTPIITVGINYRLGIPGFLYSEDFKAAGYKPNRGLLDQQLALKWIRDHIKGFGGDPERVTAGGESAGASALTMHFQSEEKLFNQAIAMSGTDVAVKAVPGFVGEITWNKAAEVLELKGTGEEKVKQLLAMKGLDMLGKAGMAVQTMPIIDGEVVKFGTTYEMLKEQGTIPGTKWLNRLLIGDCGFDGNIMFIHLGRHKQGIASKFIAIAEKTLPADAAKRLVDVYGLTPLTDDDKAFLQVLRFANDIAFYIPTKAYASHLAAAGKDTFVYRFNAANPWPGQFHGEATHILDIAYLFQNFNEFLPSDKEREVAKKMAGVFIDFTVGKTPVEKRTKEGGKAIVFGNSGVEVVDDLPEKTGRNKAFEDLGNEIGFSKLDATLGALMTS
ncbi:Carboxylesterase-like protein 8 [Elsinoe fawcettii]|nr:Carboxylesterase-like protein 8 [Elsinoe fawcettii]